MEQNFDYCNFQSDLSKMNLFKGEKVILTAKIFKINDRGVRQERILAITDKALYNVNKKKIKRKILLENLSAISLSNLSCEFVLHIENEYDYRFSSHDLRYEIIKCILLVAKNILKKDVINIYYYDSINLNNITTTEKVLKSGKRKELDSKVLEKMNYEKFVSKHEVNIQRKTEMRSKTKTLIKPNKDAKDVCMDDFELLKVLGKGAFGKVVLAEKIDTQKLYAIKILKKQDIIDTDQLEHTKAEKMILQHVNHPFIVNLDYCFQTPEKIYFVIEFMKGGEMFQHMKNARRFDEKRTKFYIACIALALGHLHNKNYIYRDLKLENILLDEHGYSKLTDFGLAKFISNNEKALTFCGTPEYLAPEVILGQGHNRPADWWSLGILAYEMMFGLPPFYHNVAQNMYRKIVKEEVVFKPNINISEEGKDFIRNSLIKDQYKRLGSAGDSLEIMSHPWFKDIDWTKMMAKKITPPFIPNCSNDDWINNFDDEFIKEEVRDSVSNKVDLDVLKGIQSEFSEFNYNKDNN